MKRAALIALIAGLSGCAFVIQGPRRKYCFPSWGRIGQVCNSLIDR